MERIEFVGGLVKFKFNVGLSQSFNTLSLFSGLFFFFLPRQRFLPFDKSPILTAKSDDIPREANELTCLLFKFYWIHPWAVFRATNKMFVPIFTLNLNQKVLPGRVTVGEYDGKQACLTAATTAEKVRKFPL